MEAKQLEQLLRDAHREGWYDRKAAETQYRGIPYHPSLFTRSQARKNFKALMAKEGEQ